MYILTNGRLITRDPDAKGYYEKGAVVYEGSKIVEVGEEAALTAKYPQAEGSTPRAASSCPRSSTRTRIFIPRWPAAFPSSETTPPTF